MPEGAVQNYEYDDLDNISKLAEIQGNKIEETSYIYDKNSRLLLQETENGSEVKQNRFTYDLNGSQLTKDEVVKRNGNTVSSKSTQFWYDGYNQLSRVKDPNGQFIDYTYNGSGLRTKKDFGDKASNYLYDNGNNIIMETDQENKVSAKNIRGLKLIYRESYANSITDPTYLYYLHNAHGDVTQLLNEQGEVIKDYRYDPFGEEQLVESLAFGGKQATELWRQEIEEIDNPFRYAGEYQDEETGNYYLRARYYDTSTQRFINEDSYGVEKGAAWSEHLYGYGNNNPLRFIDPTGHRLTETGSSSNQGRFTVTAGKTTVKGGKKPKPQPKAPAKTAAQVKGSDKALPSSTTSKKTSTTPTTEGTGQSTSTSMGQKIKQGAQNLINDNSPLGNWVQGVTGKTLITGETLSPELRQKAIDKGTELLVSGFVGMSGGIRTSGPGIQITPDGVALPPGRTIPGKLTENPYRSGSYGTINPETGKFKESLRIDPATPPGKKGPNYSHYHVDGGGEHYSPRPGDSDPWPW